MLKAALIGYGYWGPNLLRNLYQSNKFEGIVLCEKDESRSIYAKTIYPDLKVCDNSSELYKDHDIDVVFIATPSSTHYLLAKEALFAGKHVFVEKPFTLVKSQCLELLEIAAQKKLKIITDHTYVYNPFVTKTKEIIDSHDFGEIQYYHSNRINLGNFQEDTNVVWDLAIHDVSIILYLFEKRPLTVSAVGFKYANTQQECLSYCTLMFENAIAHTNVSWLSPIKIRQILVGGSKKMISIDELDNIEKVKVYDKGIDVSKDPNSIRDTLISYRTGDVWGPLVSSREALAIELEHFASAILNDTEPLTGPAHILNTMSILDALEKSLRSGGSEVEVQYE